MLGEDQYTDGDFSTEQEALDAFDASINPEHWTIQEQIEGTFYSPNVFAKPQQFRIDRVLVPTPKLFSLGWESGPVGVEIKQSGIKMGPALSQARDYANCVWRLKSKAGDFLTILRNVFLFPAKSPHGTLLSLLTSERVGFANFYKIYQQNQNGQNVGFDSLSLHLAGQRIYCSKEGPRIESARRSGAKSGSR